MLSSPNRGEWLKAIQKEVKACIDRGTFRVLGPSELGGKKPMTSRFVFSIKSDGTYKARWVAQGFSQIKGVNYMETYSPTTFFKSVTSILHIASSKGFEVITMDVGNAFLEAKIDFNIKMKSPKGLWNLFGLPDHNLEVMQALYGLKQAGRLWFKLLVKILMEFGFQQNIFDPCSFVYESGGEKIMACCHVDDLLLAISSAKIKKKLVDFLRSRLKEVKVFEKDIVYLGVRIDKTEQGKFKLSQARYVEEILKFLEPDAKPSRYPIKEDGLGTKVGGKNRPIHDVIGKLRFLVDRTRPDLLYPLNVLSRYCANPNDAVVRELNRLLRYVKATKDLNLVIGGGKGSKINLFGMSDAAYVQHGDCRSALGYVICMGKDSAPVYSRAMRAATVSLSSTQAEVEALVEVTKEIMWYQGFVKHLGVSVEDPTGIYTDNMPLVNLASEGNHLRKSKHYVVKTTFVKEQVQMGTISVQHVPGKENVSDLLTKPLSGGLLVTHTKTILGKVNQS